MPIFTRKKGKNYTRSRYEKHVFFKKQKYEGLVFSVLVVLFFFFNGSASYLF